MVLSAELQMNANGFELCKIFIVKLRTSNEHIHTAVTLSSYDNLNQTSAYAVGSFLIENSAHIVSSHFMHFIINPRFHLYMSGAIYMICRLFLGW